MVLDQKRYPDEVAIRYEFPLNARSGHLLKHIPTGEHFYGSTPNGWGGGSIGGGGGGEVFKHQIGPNQTLFDQMGFDFHIDPKNYGVNNGNSIIRVDMMYLQLTLETPSSLKFYHLSGNNVYAPRYMAGDGYNGVATFAFNYPDLNLPAYQSETDPLETRIDNAFIRFYDHYLEDQRNP